MKKKLVAGLLAMAMVTSMFTGCGKAKDDADSTEKSESSADEKSSKDSSSKLDNSKGRVVGPDSKWDGVFTDSNGKRFWAGMTINDIIEQGCAVSPNYFSDDHDVIMNAATEMSVAPLTDSENYGSGYDCLRVWDVDGDSFSTNHFDQELWFYNPYPYAVPFGECKVGSIIAGLGDIEGSDEWDTNGDESLQFEELEAVFDIAPITNEYDTHLYPFEDFVVDFMADEGHIMRSPIQSDCRDVLVGHDDELSEYKRNFTREYKTENLDTSLDSYTFKMAIGEYTIDLSYFDTIEEMTRTYLDESDYTSKFFVKGINADGDYVQVTLEQGDDYLYCYDMETYAKKNTLDSEAAGGETIYYRTSPYNSVSKFANGTILLDVSVDGAPDAAHTLSIKHQIESIISGDGLDATATPEEDVETEAETEAE